ncbi:MAG: hypothetical protein U5L00_17690 [Desulfovermiculus sp.]|nr:hypothetical protein [Desulfovermiculus sp.]
MSKKNNGQGWSLIFEEQTCIRTQARVFKVPHHGSHNAHHDRVWAEVCNPGVEAVRLRLFEAQPGFQPWKIVSGFVALQTRPMPQLHQLLEALKDTEPAVRKEFGELGIKLRAAQPKTGQVSFERRCLYRL